MACLADENVSQTSRGDVARWCADMAVVQLPVTRWLRAGASLAAGRSASAGAFFAPDLVQVIRGWRRKHRFDACIASASSLGPYLRLPELSGVRKLVDVMDVDSEKWRDYARTSRGPRSWLYGCEAAAVRRLEREILGLADAVTLVSQQEADLLRNVAGDGPIHAVKIGVDLNYFTPQDTAVEQRCVFVGSMDYRPNVDAVVWFCDHVWPKVLAQRPEARFAS